jgi:autotransporter translocation and assembly factor TamB
MSIISKSLFKKLLKILLWIAGIVIIFLIAILIFIQTNSFNKLALDFALEKLNENWKPKNSEIQIKSVNGNILSGLNIDSILITIEKDTILNINSIGLKYDIWGLPNKEIRLQNIIVSSPNVNFTQIKDSTGNFLWNFSKLFSSSEETDTSASAFDWNIVLDDLKIENGFFTTKSITSDSVIKQQSQSLTQNKSNFDFNNLIISELYLDLKAKYFINNKSLTIENLSYKTDSDFRLDSLKLKADINIKDTVTMLSGLKIITGRSDLKMDKLLIENLNPFDSTSFENFKDKFFEAAINIEKLDFDDVKYFVPEAEDLDSVISLQIYAKGKYGDFNLSDLTLRLPDSYINLSGNVKNLDVPDSLYLDLTANNLNILPNDIKSVYKSNSVPDLSQLGRITSDIKFTGTFNKFFTDFDINSSAGNVNGLINLDLVNEIYNGKVKTDNLNIGRVLGDNSLKSNLNTYSEFSGSGFELKNMSANLKYDISKSTFTNYDIRKSAGIINIQRNNVNLNLNLFSSIANTEIKGNIKIADLNNPSYSLKGKVNELNISRLTNNPDDLSNLNFTFDIDGRGIDLNNINGRFDFDIGNSSYAEYNIPALPVNIQINNSSVSNSYALKSDILDVNVSGNFTFESLSKVINNNIELISARFKNVLSPDSVPLSENNIDIYNFSGFESDNFNLNYELKMDNPAIAEEILQPFGIIFNGNIEGSFVNDNNQFSANANLNAQKFKYQDTLIVLNNFKSDLSLTNTYSLVKNDGSVSSFEINLNAKGDSVIYQNSQYDSVNIDLNLNNSLANIKVTGKQDSALAAYLKGKIDLQENPLTATFDSVRFNYGNILISNNKDWIIKYVPNQEIGFEQFVIKSDSVYLNLKGNYSFNGNSDLSLVGKDIPLADIYAIIFPVDSGKTLVRKQYPVQGNINDLFVNYKGDFENPQITAGVQTGKLVYIGSEENQDIGNFKFNLDYKNESADILIDLKNAVDKGALNITGTIPYSNPFKESDSLNGGITGPADFQLISKDFEIKYFLKTLPFLPDIGGKLNGEITATGNASAPELKGSLSMNDGSVFLGMTGMNYKFNFNSSTENSKLVINKLSLSSAGDEARHFDIFGDIDFSGMKINEINLKTSGDMVIIDKSVSENESGIYGYLRAGSGSPAVSIKGNLDKLSVSGQLLIIDATISSIPLGGSGYDNKTDNFVYMSVSDSAQSDDNLKIITEESDYYKINPFERSKYLLSGKETNSSSFLDLDINVKTQKSMYVSIDFDNITKDRLFGEIKTDLNIKTQDKEFAAFGEVNIINNSYYRFYKDFKLKDSKIIFNGSVNNPELNIQAVYESSKTTEGYGTTTTIPVQVKLTISGKLDDPEIALNLIEDGSEVSGTDAQADAITFLLFGKYKSELSANERTSIASSLGTSLGSLYISSIVSQTVRQILPFLVDAQFKYSKGNIKDTDVELTSAIGEATVKIGGKLLKDVRNFEFAIEYPLNNFLNLDLPETLLLIFSREEESNTVFGSSETSTNTGLKVLYRIKN